MTAADRGASALADGASTFRAYRAWTFLIPPAVLLLGAALARMNSGGLALILIAEGVVAVLAVPHAVGGWVRIGGPRLTASRPFAATEAPRGGVDLTALVRISSVGRKYGTFVDRGLPIFRLMFRIQDGSGGEAWIEAWGWSSQERLFGELRRAALSSGAHVDEMTFRRLGFSDTQRTGSSR